MHKKILCVALTLLCVLCYAVPASAALVNWDDVENLSGAFSDEWAAAESDFESVNESEEYTTKAVVTESVKKRVSVKMSLPNLEKFSKVTITVQKTGSDTVSTLVFYKESGWSIICMITPGEYKITGIFGEANSNEYYLTTEKSKDKKFTVHDSENQDIVLNVVEGEKSYTWRSIFKNNVLFSVLIIACCIGLAVIKIKQRQRK